MSRSKRLFVAGFILFFIALFYASYDISKRTTFPGSKPQLKERLKKVYQDPDSIKTDTIQ